MTFIDLFAGLGGFHKALDELGHECVFASEIKPALIKLYEENFGFKPVGDIRKICVTDIPKHNILCAGFPCQPFSKAGSQKGLDDINNGGLFQDIIRILEHHKPEYFILENVQHLAKHNNQATYNYMSLMLKDVLGYKVMGEILSPHEFNIPQHRQRLFIVGCKTDISHFQWPTKLKLESSIYNYLDSSAEIIPLEKEKKECLNVWQEFLEAIPMVEKLPSFPIWAMEFGATYPFEKTTPFNSKLKDLSKFRGSFGTELQNKNRQEIFNNLPNYARTEELVFPKWKQNYIRQNREFYLKHQKSLKVVVSKIKDLNVPSWQKFEWNIQGGQRDITKFIIQFRGSGIRLKKPDFFPSLVCVSTQIPIIGWENRYLSKWEAAKLQGLNKLSKLPEIKGTCFDALGNSVNVNIVKLIAEKLIQSVYSKNEVRESTHPELFV